MGKMGHIDIKKVENSQSLYYRGFIEIPFAIYQDQPNWVPWFNKDIQSDHVWPAPTRSRRIRGTPDAVMESAYTDFYVRRGYVNIIGSVRGTGRSGGESR